jgi:hypothetical protein
MSRPPDEYIEFEATVERSTLKALLVYPLEAPPEDPPVWLPKSQVTILEEARDGEPALLKIPLWLARKQGWI